MSADILPDRQQATSITCPVPQGKCSTTPACLTCSQQCHERGRMPLQAPSLLDSVSCWPTVKTSTSTSPPLDNISSALTGQTSPADARIEADCSTANTERLDCISLRKSDHNGLHQMTPCGDMPSAQECKCFSALPTSSLAFWARSQVFLEAFWLEGVAFWYCFCAAAH